MSRPFVSVLTPTYNRVQFIPRLIECYKAQIYPKEFMEWIILDDGQELCKDIIEQASKEIPNIRYIQLEEKLNIGEKRNILNNEAKGEIIVCMDDDDYYSPYRVSHAVEELVKQPKIKLAGSSIMYMYYTDTKEIYILGPYGPNHATNGTMAYRSSYAKTHKYDEMVIYAEERSFLEEYIHPMIQLNPLKVMLVMSHSENTFDKDKLRNNKSNFIKKTGLTLDAFISDKELLKEFLA
jgi:glycosyltransferase involved in cell wall biosynthesis